LATLARGLYEQLLTELLQGELEGQPSDRTVQLSKLHPAEAPDRIALHLATVIERALSGLPDDDRIAAGVALARELIERIVSAAQDDDLAAERPVDGQILQAVNLLRPDGKPEEIEKPGIPLLDTTLLTNAPGEPRVGRQILAEIASADRIDVVMAFIRRSGITPLREALRRHTQAGRSLRVLTTTYTGSTELEALELLREIGAEVKVSYDTSSTRLHAKAWLFHRESTYSTAYVGSSNLTHSAQVTGLEWNMRVSAARNRAVVEKIAAVFESYWQQPDFEPYDRATFEEAMRRAEGDQEPEFALSLVEVRLEPFQERLLEQIELARQQGHHRNLLVSATGTGKTVMAAVDYARLQARLPRARLLFVAHREEILDQSRATFRHVLRDGSFGEKWVGGERPRDFEHVFASIQSLNAARLDALAADHFDVVIVDEFHHAAADSYVALLDHVQPQQLLGLTATPERSDGLPLLDRFDGRIAAELRLWDAIDQHRLTPFAYYGIADELDLREIPWRRGSGYDVEGLTGLITSNDVWARRVLKELGEHVGGVQRIRALGFCVSVAHARYMARVFNEHGIAAKAIWADTPGDERRGALSALRRGEVKIVFSVDLFNEGVDVPLVDTLLLLRPTDSSILFLQQLGRGLRKAPEKTICTVLDFVGQHRKEFRYDRRFQALLGGTRKKVAEQVEQGFPYLPAGCHMELDRVASERVLQSIKNSVPDRWAEKVAELRAMAAGGQQVSLKAFLEASGLELDDIYKNGRSWSDLQEAAELAPAVLDAGEAVLRKACGRLLHVDDPERLGQWTEWLTADQPPDISALTSRSRRLLRMLLVQVLDQMPSVTGETSLTAGAALLWQYPQVRAELLDLFEVLADQMPHLATPLSQLSEVPLNVHARYTRLEMLAATGNEDRVKVRAWREGAAFIKELPADLFVFTLDKTGGQFSPTTRYKDYAISRELLHWESQSTTRAASPTGTRYQNHEAMRSHILLFARLNTAERAFLFLGPGSYVSYVGETPMAVTWRLNTPLPGDVFQAFAAAVA
jgi:superfamily II DNA or RNA helicase/HKD family nuclease